ncbi:LEMD2 protein, partial [Bucco capensis]|nr:LEMD2 protein [Bucco capensis]
MAELTDAELRKELLALGYQPGPITATTRKVYIKKLGCLRAEVAAAKRSHVGAADDSEEEEEEEEEEVEREERGQAPASRWRASREGGGLSWGDSRGSPPGRGGGLSSRAEESLSRDSFRGLSPSVQWGTVRKEAEREQKPSSWAGGLLRRFPWKASSSTGNHWEGSGAGQGITPRPHLMRSAPKQQKEGKGKGLEHYFSQFLCLASFVLLLIFLGILVVKMIGSGWLDRREENFHLLPVDCDKRTDDFCQAKQKDIIMNILKELYNYLSIQAGNFECGNPENLKSKCIWVNEAKDHVVNITGNSSEKFQAALHWILNSNKDLGIWLKGKDLSEAVSSVEEVFCLESAHPQMRLGCRFRRAVVTAIMNLLLFFW